MKMCSKKFPTELLPLGPPFSKKTKKSLAKGMEGFKSVGLFLENQRYIPSVNRVKWMVWFGLLYQCSFTGELVNIDTQ